MNFTNYQLPITHYPLPITLFPSFNYKPVTLGELLINYPVKSGRVI
ncbi:hypothetical protein H6F39_19565 [Anabaena sp. FACHB-1250]|uniref:Uncharacterized protein n=1 Tax=Dolichospermum flos-aquae LEGE 04289 TaxID=1828708 RepID=A0ACC5Q3C6_DOLFA|nr:MULTISPECIES: hypothetical protein [Nostocales]MBD2143485.1 hypothetical protein [Anabaena sp. FACHB-1250]MBD2269977.1 hypothetical protein [Anabaena sp. FACHB-1391]MBE9219058.1 hypothetical protein [Dolichospermum flos-aquae LEGE 04289]